MSEPNIYVVECEVDADYREEFEAWYADRHGPDLVRSGFHSAQMLANIDEEAAYLTVYDAPEHNVFTSDVYAAARAADKVLPVAEGRIGDRMTKGRFAHHLVGGRANDMLPAVDSDILFTLRTQAGDDELELGEKWVTEVLAPRLVEAGAVRVWWSRLASLHNLFPHLVPPNGLVVVEALDPALPVAHVVESAGGGDAGALQFDIKRYRRFVRIAH